MKTKQKMKCLCKPNDERLILVEMCDVCLNIVGGEVCDIKEYQQLERDSLQLQKIKEMLQSVNLAKLTDPSDFIKELQQLIIDDHHIS